MREVSPYSRAWCTPGIGARYESILRLALFVLIACVVPLQAQSITDHMSLPHEPVINLDLWNGTGVGACGASFAVRHARKVAGGLEDARTCKEEPPQPRTSKPLIDAKNAVVCPDSAISQKGDQRSVSDIAPPADSDNSGGSSKATPSTLVAQPDARLDRNLDIYYRNRREFSLDVGWHPVNIPFIYDFAVGGGYNMTPLKYTLVPIVASLRWHVTNVGWKSIFRGNMDFTFSGSITAIPRGPETHYYSFDFGIRRNFVYRNWKLVPFFEQRGGAGLINAKEPLGVLFAQGQNLTFTYNLGVGARYNIDSKYSFSAGMNYMHISNAYFSQPQFYNYGINVYGPMFGLDVRLGKPHHTISE